MLLTLNSQVSVSYLLAALLVLLTALQVLLVLVRAPVPALTPAHCPATAVDLPATPASAPVPDFDLNPDNAFLSLLLISSFNALYRGLSKNQECGYCVLRMY